MLARGECEYLFLMVIYNSDSVTTIPQKSYSPLIGCMPGTYNIAVEASA